MDLFVLKTDDYFNNSTCIFGASISDRQLELLKDFKQVVYIPDSDNAGMKVLDKLKDLGDNISYLKLPEEINGVKIKDIGDIPKTNITVNQLRTHNWLNYIKPIGDYVCTI